MVVRRPFECIELPNGIQIDIGLEATTLAPEAWNQS